MICPQCGSSVSDGTRFCGACGREVMAADSFPVPSSSLPAAATPSSTSGKAIASLILGILPLSVLSSIPGVILGHLALSDIKKSAGRLSGKGMAIAGLILGYMGIALFPISMAIMIPNLLRARMAANESAAVGSMRIINTAQISYQSMYPEAGYAATLSALGSASPGACASPSAANACLIPFALSNATTPATAKTGYYFNAAGGGKSYFVSAMPAVPNQSGVRSFCSAEDAVVRVDLSGSVIADAAACAALPTLE